MDPIIIVAIITGVFGLLNAWQNKKLNAKVKTNHGKTIGQHVEQAAVSAADAKEAALKVAEELVTYRLGQAARDRQIIDTLEAHTESDERHFAELRAMIGEAA